jgi:transcription antitermination factor NusG
MSYENLANKSIEKLHIVISKFSTMKKNWYAVYTKPHCELKVAASLTRKKIDNYCPLNRVGNYQSIRKKTSYEPLFPSFVFVYISESEIPFIRQTADVINFIYWLGKPAMVKETEIRGMHDFTNAHCNIKLEKTIVNTTAMVRVLNETGNSVENGSTDSLIKLSLPSLGYLIVAATNNMWDEYNYAYEGRKMVS